MAIVLVAVRFATPTVVAVLGVAGVDTAPLAGALYGYDLILPAVLFPMAVLALATWPGGFRLGGFRLDFGVALAVTSAVAAAVLWAGEVDPSVRVSGGPWASLPLGAAVALAILGSTLALDARLRETGTPLGARTGLRTLGLGLGLAYLVRALRLVDYGTALGGPLPSGLLWLLDYTPVLLLSSLSVFEWGRVVLFRAHGRAGFARALAPPVVVGLAGSAVATGAGGFYLSNALTWGGSYVVFGPTVVSLFVVGFAIGAFAATSWSLLARLPRTAWRLLTGGVTVAGLAGLVAFAGSLTSLAGIVLALTIVGIGLSEVPGPSLALPVGPGLAVAETPGD